MTGWGDRIKTGFGFVAHLALLPFVLASGLIVPWWAMAGLLFVWLVLFVYALRQRRDENQVFAVPIVMVTLLVLVPLVGEALFDWTA